MQFSIGAGIILFLWMCISCAITDDIECHNVDMAARYDIIKYQGSFYYYDGISTVGLFPPRKVIDLKRLQNGKPIGFIEHENHDDNPWNCPTFQLCEGDCLVENNFIIKQKDGSYTPNQSLLGVGINGRVGVEVGGFVMGSDGKLRQKMF